MRIHPIANIFPEMSDSSFELLKEDIKTNGCLTPIWTFNNEIIDGRHRLKACEELGMTPEYRTYEGDPSKILDFIVSQNLHRRHLTESQRAMVAANIANLPPGNPNGKKTDNGVSLTDAARMLNVGSRSVSCARIIRDKGSSLLKQKVNNGEITVSAAEKIARHDHKTQDKAIGSGARTAKALSKLTRTRSQETKCDTEFQLTQLYKSSGGKLLSEKYPSPEELLKALQKIVKDKGWDSITIERI